MELKIRFLKWSAGLPVAMLNGKTASGLGVHVKDRILLKNSSGVIYSTIIDTIEDFLHDGEIAVSSELKEQLNLKSGQIVRVSLAPALKSTNFIKKKLLGGELSEEELNEIIHDVVINTLSEAEIGFFIAAMYRNGMSLSETASLTKAIFENGNKLSFSGKYIVDKHCIGGIPGNRTSPIVVAICTAAGLIMPKSSSRAITSASGTADVIETIAKVEFRTDEMKKIIRKTGGCLVWGGGLGMVTADDKIIKIEKVLNLDPQSQMIASIFSKKLAMGSKYILIDVPYGKGAKVENLKKARELKKKFEYLGKHFGKKIRVVLTDGSQPIGNGIGPALELIDVINVLNPDFGNCPVDLKEKSIFLAGEILEMTGTAKRKKGRAMAREIIESGKALKKFREIIESQDGDFRRLNNSAKFEKNIFAKKSGRVILIDNPSLAFTARTAGCPSDKFAGIYLNVHVGDSVRKNQKLLTIYAESKMRLEEAVEFYNSNLPITIK